MDPEVERILVEELHHLDGDEEDDLFCLGDVTAANPSVEQEPKADPSFQDTTIIDNGMDPENVEDSAVDHVSLSKKKDDNIDDLRAFLERVLPQATVLGLVLALAGAMQVAEWKQLFHLHLEVTMGEEQQRVSIPGTALLFFLAVASFLIPVQHFKQQPQNKQDLDIQNNNGCTRPLTQTLAEEEIQSSRSSNDIDIVLEEEWEKQQHDCRCQLAKVLGSIGAPILSPNGQVVTTTLQETSNHDQIPSPSSSTATCTHDAMINDEKKEPTFKKDKWHPTLVQTAKAHTRLIHTMDTTMEILKVGAALHLGATERTAERVERALLGRQTTRLQNSNNGIPRNDKTSSTTMPVSFPTIRNLLMDAMFHQVESLLMVNNNYNNKEGIINISKEDVLGEVPPVITLTWLRESRQQLAGLLSHVLEELCSAPTQNEYNSTAGNNLLLLLQSKRTAKELQVHLLHTLDLDESQGVVATETAPESSSLSAPLKERLVKLRAHYQKVFVALWAMEDSATTSTEQQDGAIMSLETKDWWARMNEINDEISVVLECIDHDFFLEEEEPASEELADQEGGMAIPTKGAQSYTVDTGATANIQLKSVAAAAKPTKTSVFSGKGAKQPEQTRQKKASVGSKNSDTQSSPAVLQADPVAQHFLLSELRTRLQTLALPEEEHEVNLDVNDQNETSSLSQRSQSSQTKTTAIPLFGGAAGSLLVGDLKNAVKLLGNEVEDDSLSVGGDEGN
ncbi:(DC) complex [Seminavis robusta]|uniref:(DC) complex n=1 Tax=Seminavis robusta TaxID=568900 RepID=A0A9N8EKN6_9STRA|nr:(DC) complex [Seminavis robusta]|eukprot:Sro1140_g245550.1 (DC) complex (735) ;mRNA; r:24296-26500